MCHQNACRKHWKRKRQTINTRLSETVKLTYAISCLGKNWAITSLLFHPGSLDSELKLSRSPLNRKEWTWPIMHCATLPDRVWKHLLSSCSTTASPGALYLLLLILCYFHLLKISFIVTKNGHDDNLGMKTSHRLLSLSSTVNWSAMYH